MSVVIAAEWFLRASKMQRYKTPGTSTAGADNF
jgi:hypothetical protein